MVKSSQSAVSKIQDEWAKKLEHIEVKDLNTVCTFASGGFSRVILVQLSGHPDSSFALKTLQKDKITAPCSRRRIFHEKKILSEVQSDFILKLYRTFKDKKYLYFLTEYLPGGELTKLAPKPENAAKFYVACVVEALGYLHAKNIVHNDIKLANVVMAADGYVKLIDFGFAKKLEWGEIDYEVTGGTASYSPPEIAWREIAPDDEDRFGRDRAVDLWALGVLLYNLVTRTKLFSVRGDVEGTYRNITKGIESVEFPHELFSQDAKDFIRELCAYAPNTRLGYRDFNEIRKHLWFRGFDWTKLRKKTLKPPLVPTVKSILDTRYFTGRIAPALNGKEDESNWDMYF